YANGVQVASKSQTGTITSSTSALRIGGNSVWGEYFKGLIDEVRVYNTALTVAQVQADMTTAVSPTPDTTPPTVSVTAPANGVTAHTPPPVPVTSPANNATVGGPAASVAATAADNVGVVGVQFQLDGVSLGAEDTTAPYTTSWNTTTAANGAHTLTAVARDAA